MRPSPAPSLAHAVRVGVVAIVALLLWLTFRGVDPEATLGLVRRLGTSLPVLLLPSACAVLFEVVAWQQTFSLLGAPPPFSALLRVRVATETVGNAMPLGMVWAEAAKPTLLARHADLSPATSLAGMAGRKYLLALSQAAYLVVGYVAGKRALEAGFARSLGMPGLAKTALVFALLLVLVAEGVASGLGGGRLVARTCSLLARIPSTALRGVLRGIDHGARSTDRAMVALFANRHRKMLQLSLLNVAGWLFEALETWVILRALGSHVGLGDAIGIETLVVLLRQVLVFLPAGLGALEMGYAAFLTGTGGSLDLCAAFVLLKRLRELAWLGLGGVLLVLERRPGRLIVRSFEPASTFTQR